MDLSKLLTEEERKEIADRKTAARPAMTEGGRRIVMVVAVVVAIVLILIIVRPFRVGPNVGEVAPNFTLTSTTADPWVESSPAIGADGTVFVGSSDGGSAITNYKVCRGTAPGGESYLTAMGIGLTYTDTGLTNGVTYYYQVTAVNAVGEGPRLSGGVGDAVRQRRSFGVVQRHRGVGGTTTTFTVCASVSSDSEDASAALQVRWDWQDDGTWDTPWSPTKTAQHRYPHQGRTRSASRSRTQAG